MPRSGGVYSLPAVYLAVPGTTVRAEQHNSPLQDLAASMTASLPRDGSAPMLADLPMNGRKVTGLGAGTAASDAVRFDQVPAFSTWMEALNSTVMAQDRLPYASGPNTVQLATFTAFARDLIFDANALEARETLGLPPVDQSVWNAGVSTTEAIISPAKLQAKLDASLASVALGVGQTWQAPARALATTYENTTGRPIQLCITIVGNGGPGSVELLLGATSGGITKRAGVSASAASILATLPGVIIPPGWFYRVNQTSGAIAIDTWSELRA